MTTISFELGVKSLIMTKDVLLLYRVAEIQDMDSSMKHNKNCLLILQDEIQLYTVHVFVNLGSRFFSIRTLTWPIEFLLLIKIISWLYKGYIIMSSDVISIPFPVINFLATTISNLKTKQHELYPVIRKQMLPWIELTTNQFFNQFFFYIIHDSIFLSLNSVIRMISMFL